MVTEFGRYLRVLRITKNVSAKEMAEQFDVTVSYLSAVETGKRAVPSTWEKTLIDTYDLTEDERKKLYNAIVSSSQTINVDLSKCNETKRELLYAVTRGLDDDTLEKLNEIIKKG